jgi:hypothetical protein
MGCALTFRQHQSDFIKTIVKIFFPFHLGNGMLIINVTQSIFPLTVEFNACQILHCGSLMSQLQLQGYSFYMCPIQEPTGKLVSVQSGQMWGETLGIKDTFLPFMTILRTGPDPRTLERSQFLPSRTINSLLTGYSKNYSCFRHSCFLLVKIKQYNPLRLVTESPWGMTQGPSMFHRYGLGQLSQGQTCLVPLSSI